MAEPWEVLCQDCDHGIRGGKPCESCGGRGVVSVILATDYSSLQAELAALRAETAEHPEKGQVKAT